MNSGRSVTARLVLRDGETVFNSPMAEVTNDELIRQMVEREITGLWPDAAASRG